MKNKIHDFFKKDWQRKLISLVLAIIIWLLVNNSLIIEKNFSNVPVRVTNVPKGVHVDGMSRDGFLNERITLKIVGYKKVLEDLNQEDIQVLFNANNKQKDWVALANKNQVVFLNKLINPYPLIRYVKHEPFVISVSPDSLEETP